MIDTLTFLSNLVTDVVKKAPGLARKPVSFDRKIVVAGEQYFDPMLSITKEFNVRLPEDENGNVKQQHAFLISLKGISLHDFREMEYALEVISSNAVLITMPIANHAEAYGDLLCQKEESLTALKAARNQFLADLKKNKYSLLIEFNSAKVENVFPLGKGRNNKRFVEPNLVGALLKMMKQVKVTVEVNEPMPDPTTTSSSYLMGRRSRSPQPPTKRETQVKVVEEEVVSERACWVTWSVGIEGSWSWLEFKGHGDEADLHGDKAGDFCKSMSMDDVNEMKSTRRKKIGGRQI